MKALLWPLAALVLAVWAVSVQVRLNRLRKTNLVAVSVIAYWRRMAMGINTDGTRGRYLTREELAERIASRPLTNEQADMVRGVLRGRRKNQGHNR